MKKKIKGKQEEDPDMDNVFDVLSDIIIDSYLAMTPEQRKAFIKKSKSGKK